MIVNILFYSILALNILCVLMKKKSKIVTLASILIAIYISFENTGSGDYGMYVYLYDGGIEYGEIGYSLLQRLTYAMGLTFNELQGIICTIALIIILYVFSKYSNNYQLFFALFFISEFFINVNVLRSYIARAFLLLGFHFLMNGKKMKYVLLVMLAISFHVTSVLYLPLVFLVGRDYSSKKAKRVMGTLALIILMLCVVVFVLGNKFTWLYNIMVIIMPSMQDKFDAYFTTSTRFGFMLYFMLHAGNLFLHSIGSKQMSQDQSASSMSNKIYHFSGIVNLYTILFFPLIMMNTNFCRVLNNIFFLNVIYYAMFLDSYKKATIDYYKTLISMFAVTLCSTFPLVHASNQRQAILDAFKE